MSEPISNMDALKNFNPHTLVMGIRKDGELKSILCTDKISIDAAISRMNEVRIFTLVEQNSELYKPKEK